jgi:hypothetical protein
MAMPLKATRLVDVFIAAEVGNKPQKSVDDSKLITQKLKGFTV